MIKTRNTLDSRAATTDFAFFRQHGYQILEGVISPATIKRFHAFFEQAAAAALARIKAELGFDREELTAAVDALLADGPRFAGISPELHNLLCGHLHLDARLDPIFQSMAREPGLLAVLQELFEGRPLRLHLPPAARFVLPHHHHAGVPPHQDISYNRHMDDFVTIWVPFVPIDEDCGGVGVYRGTGQHRPLDVSASPTFWNVPIEADERQLVHCIIQPGDALLLSPLVVHRSMANRSARTRYSTDFRFFAAPAQSRKHYLDMETGQVVAPASA